jgi:hypothetical protein
MKPIEMSHTNITYISPSEWDEGEHGKCINLPVSNYEGTLYSYWQVSLKERFQILFGKRIRLCIRSDSHPPVSLDLGS